MSAVNIPGYKIIRTLGVGGQATVYLAVQEGFDREVALKVMSPALAADPTFGERFIREAKIVAKLSHVRIVTVYDVGESGSFYYLAMEYMRGKELKSRIAKGVKAKDALVITAKLAQTLHFAHSKGYIHRDVKSENILFDDDEQPVLTDFGIAKASNSSTQMTQTGKLIGTPEYMSPEQCRGRKLDGRSDLYSLGIILFEMLTGRVPFTGEDSVSICIQHVTKHVPRLPARLTHFQWLIDGLLCKRAEERFQSGQELSTAIKKYLSEGEESTTVNRQNSKTVITDQIDQLDLDGRRDDFSDESFELNDDLYVEQRISSSLQSKSKVPLIVGLFIFLIASGAGYLSKEQWLPQAQQILGITSDKMNNEALPASDKLTDRGGNESIESSLTKHSKKISSAPDSKSDQSLQLRSEQKNDTVTERVGQLIQQADTLAQYSPHELSDIQQALDNLVTARSLEPNNKNIIRIKNDIIIIALDEAITSAENQLFANGKDWIKLVESADHDNAQLDATKLMIANYQSEYNSELSVRKKVQEQIASKLDAAELALSQKRLATPERDNALYYYVSVLKIDPANLLAKTGLNRVADKYIELIEISVKTKRFQQARGYLQKLKSLPFVDRDFTRLDNQVSVAKRLFAERLKEKQRKDAIIEAVRQKELLRQQKLADPLVQMRLQSNLESAASLMEQGFLVEPIGNNALEKFRSALNIDEKDKVALEGIKAIETIIIENIEVSISNKLLQPATLWVKKLRAFNPEDIRIEGYQVKLDQSPLDERPDSIEEPVKNEQLKPKVEVEVDEPLQAGFGTQVITSNDSNTLEAEKIDPSQKGTEKVIGPDIQQHNLQNQTTENQAIEAQTMENETIEEEQTIEEQTIDNQQNSIL